MFEIGGQDLGNFIEEFIEYDKKNNVNYICFFMHICILMEVLKSIKKSKEIKRQEEEWMKFFSSMNVLGSYYYLYGLLATLVSYVGKFCHCLRITELVVGIHTWRMSLVLKAALTVWNGFARLEILIYGNPQQLLMTFKNTNPNVNNANNDVIQKQTHFMADIFLNAK